MVEQALKHNQLDFTIEGYLNEFPRILSTLDLVALKKSIDIIRETFDNGKKIFTCGNGGSALTSSHFITDWTKMVNISTGRKFQGFCLSDNIGLMTAFANDCSYDQIFSGQCYSLLDEGDLLIAVSGSGNSSNIIEALNVANTIGARTLGILGFDGGKAVSLADHSFIVPSFDMQICEDIHLMFGHMVMKSLCNSTIKIMK